MKIFAKTPMLLSLGLAFLTLTIFVQAADKSEPTEKKVDNWEYFRGNSLSQGVAQSLLPEKPELLWEFEVKEGAFEVTPAIVDGVIYVGDLDGALFALNLKDGKQIWKSTIESGFVSSVAYRDGQIYLGDYDGVFYCFRAKDGKKLWEYETGAEVNSSANFYKEHVLVGSQDATLYCLAAKDGSLIWKHELADQIRCSPTVVGDRTFVAGCDAKLHIIDLAKGEKITEVELDGPTGSTPAVLGDNVYFGTEGASVFSINFKKAEVDWQYTNEATTLPYRSSVAIHDGIVIIGGQNRFVHAFQTRDGKEIWQKQIRGMRRSFTGNCWKTSFCRWF